MSSYSSSPAISSELAVFEALRPELLRLAESLIYVHAAPLRAGPIVDAVLVSIRSCLQAGSLAAAALDQPRRFAFAALRGQFEGELAACRTGRVARVGSPRRVIVLVVVTALVATAALSALVGRRGAPRARPPHLDVQVAPGAR
jgi:hypothetical protein